MGFHVMESPASIYGGNKSALLTMTPGREQDIVTALFLMTSGTIVDNMAEAVKGLEFEIISTSLSKGD